MIALGCQVARDAAYTTILEAHISILETHVPIPEVSIPPPLLICLCCLDNQSVAYRANIQELSRQ